MLGFGVQRLDASKPKGNSYAQVLVNIGCKDVESGESGGYN